MNYSYQRLQKLSELGPKEYNKIVRYVGGFPDFRNRLEITLARTMILNYKEKLVSVFHDGYINGLTIEDITEVSLQVFDYWRDVFTDGLFIFGAPQLLGTLVDENMSLKELEKIPYNPIDEYIRKEILYHQLHLFNKRLQEKVETLNGNLFEQ